MTDDQLVFWRAYIRVLADLYGLKDWDVRVARDKPGDGCGADCLIWYGQRRAMVRLGAEPFGLVVEDARHDQRRMALHELTHCHTEYAEEAVRLALRDDDNPRLDLFREYFKRSMEMAVDSIATAIAPMFPLPGDA